MYKHHRLSFLIMQVIFLVTFVSNVFAQSLNQDTIDVRFEEYNKKNLQEKIFVHTDKELYLSGEIIWFKLYNTHRVSNKPLSMSAIAYVEIVDKNQKPVLQAKIAMDKGSGSGSLYLPGALSSGNYQFRAYTSWMKNFSSEFFFEKSIRIVNSLVKPEKQQPADDARNYDVQFFPEGGQMVENLPAKVAFRAIDSQGKGVQFKGTLMDGNNNTLLSFSPLKFGIGSFSFVPESNKSYRVLIEIPGSKNIVKELSPVKTGYVLQLESAAENQIKVKIYANSVTPVQQVFLFVHTRQEPKINEPIALNEGKAEYLLDKNKLAEGISHFTLFSPSGDALAERLYFTRPTSRLHIVAKADQQQYAPRKKVTVELLFKDERGLSTDVDASISVFASNGSEAEETDIFNYLWLKSDLKGNVESPAYYLKNDDAVANEALDNLMLTHGWRRFAWQKVIGKSKTMNEFLPEIDGHIISGKIVDIRNGTPAKNIMTYLSVPGKKLHLYGSASNADGHIRFYARDIYGPAEIVVQTDIRQDSTYRIELSSPFSDQYSAIDPAVMNLSQDLRKQIVTQSLGIQVQNAYVANKLSTFYPALTDSNAFYVKPDKRYVLDNFVRFNTMEEVLREYVAEVPVTRQKDDFSIWVVSRPHIEDIPKVVIPLILMDGVPIFDSGNKIIKYDPKKVRTLDIVAQKYYLGPLNFNAILNFTTYKGTLPEFQLDPRATIMDYEGLQLKREFYSPLYETSDQAKSRIPDFRNVLYWSPDIQINSSGKRTISFYTSDQENNYTIMLQGLSSSGKSGSASFIIQVRK